MQIFFIVIKYTYKILRDLFMKNLFLILLLITVFQSSMQAQTVYDDNYVENPNYVQGNKYLENAQYSSAINEFKKAIRTNSNDSSALIGLSNAYNMRAEYYNNTVKSPQNAISDIKSALFFLKYFPSVANQSLTQSIAAMEKNLSLLEVSQKQGLSPDSRLKTAKESRIKGEFAAAAFDFYQILSNEKYAKEANVALGDIFKIFNRPDKAVNFYRNALQFDGDNPDIRLKLARTYEQLNDFSSSLQEYSFVLNTSYEHNEILNSLERIWQKKVDENPKDAEAHANLGVIFQKQKRYTEALAEYIKAQELNPANLNTKLNIGTLYQEQNKYHDAIAVYNSVLQLQPNNINALINKADCAKALNRNEEAISLYKTALNLDNKNTAVKAKLFELLKNTMPTDDVLAFLYNNVLNSPMSADSCYEFAYELHKAGKIDDAITYYLQTINLDKTKTDAYINLSQAYRQKKNYNEALNIIKRAKDIAPDNELVTKQYDTVWAETETNILNAAINAFQSGDYGLAINEYMKMNPQTVDSLTGIAAAYQYLKNYPEAINYYKKAYELDERNQDIPYYIASLYINENNLPEAKKYVESALSVNPQNNKVLELQKYISDKDTEKLLTEAVKLYDEQKYKEAIDMFSNVIAQNPSNATVYYYRAMSFDALKSYKEAISDYKSTLKYAPEMVIAYYSLGVDYDYLSNYKAAKENYQKYVDLSESDDDYKKYAQTRINEIK